MNVHDSMKKYGLSGFDLKVGSSDAGKCPVCEAKADPRSGELCNDGSVIRVERTCPECGSYYALFYPLDWARVYVDNITEEE